MICGKMIQEKNQKFENTKKAEDELDGKLKKLDNTIFKLFEDYTEKLNEKLKEKEKKINENIESKKEETNKKNKNKEKNLMKNLMTFSMQLKINLIKQQTIIKKTS